MSANVQFNPIETVNAGGTFSVDTVGLIQGTFYDDPAVRYALAGGVVSPSAGAPMWGGEAICELIPPVGAAPQPATVLGAVLELAESIASTAPVTGFTVFNQGHNALNFPQSPVPQFAPGMTINYFRLGSGARIAVACDPALAADLEGDPVNSQVSWDFTGQLLVPYTPAYGPVTITGATWANTSGGQATYTVSTDLTSDLAAGDIIDISGIDPAGYNGEWGVVSVSSTTVVVSLPAAATPGSYVSGGSIAAAGGALPCKVIEFDTTNSMTVNFNAATGFLTWNRQGSAAVILI